MADNANYKNIVGSEPTPETISRFAQIKDTLNLRDDDALWSVVYMLEMYTRTIGDFNIKTKRAILEALIQYAEAGGIIKYVDGAEGESKENKSVLVALLVLIIGFIFLFGVAMFTIGVKMNEFSPGWIRGISGSGSKMLGYILGAPAGWILIVLLPLPSLFIISTQIKILRTGCDKGRRLEAIAIAAAAILIIILSISVLLRMFPAVAS